MRPFVEAIVDSGLDLQIAIAGGLGPGNVSPVEPLVTLFPRISICAEARLHYNANRLEGFDISRGKQYISDAVAMVCRSTMER